MAAWVGGFVGRVLNGTAPAPRPMPIPWTPPVNVNDNRDTSGGGDGSTVGGRGGGGSDGDGGGGGDSGGVGGDGGVMVYTVGQDLGVEGKGWPASENPAGFWRRLPDRAEGNLSNPTSRCVDHR